VGKTEWLKQNVPDISKGTFYAAFNAVKARCDEQERLMLGGEVPAAPQRKTRTNNLTPMQSEVVTALVAQGYKNKDAILMVKEAEGEDFDSLLKAVLARRAGKVIEFADHKKQLEDEDESGAGELDRGTDSGEAASEPDTEVTPEEAPVQPTPAMTYGDWETYWETHPLPPASEYGRKHFAEAATSFIDRYRYAFDSSAFKKILAMLEDNPDQVRANGDDFARIATVLLAAAENANLLAALIVSTVNSEAFSVEPKEGL
jgi:hypothetical protein